MWDHMTWSCEIRILTVVGSLGGRAGGGLLSALVAVDGLVLTDGTGLGGTDGGDVAKSYIW